MLRWSLIFLLPFLALLTTPSSAQCPPNTFNATELRECVHIELAPANRSQQWDMCAGLKGYLISIHSLYQNNALVQYASEVSPSAGLLYTALYYEQVGHIQFWENWDGTTVDYLNWAPGEPTPGVQCATIDVPSGKWYAVDCGRPLGAICEIYYPRA
ncbi:unnamed protein product, partial [Mesorhabditis spiculigera]